MGRSELRIPQLNQHYKANSFDSLMKQFNVQIEGTLVWHTLCAQTACTCLHKVLVDTVLRVASKVSCFVVSWLTLAVLTLKYGQLARTGQHVTEKSFIGFYFPRSSSPA